METNAEVEWLEPDSPSLSICYECKHKSNVPGMAACTAYPKGIPEHWLFTLQIHTAVEADQVGRDVFTARDIAYTESILDVKLNADGQFAN